jgi:hypothetical protein
MWIEAVNETWSACCFHMVRYIQNEGHIFPCFADWHDYGRLSFTIQKSDTPNPQGAPDASHNAYSLLYELLNDEKVSANCSSSNATAANSIASRKIFRGLLPRLRTN